MAGNYFNFIPNNLGYTLAINKTLISEINRGTRKTGVDPGYEGEIFFDDDYMYICTQTGNIGEAIWKKVLLVNT